MAAGNGRPVDVVLVLTRIDKRLARKAGEDSLLGASLEEFAAAVDAEIVEPVLAAMTASGVRALLERQAALIVRLREQLSEKDCDVNEARAARDTARSRVRDFVAGMEPLEQLLDRVRAELVELGFRAERAR